MPTRDNIAQNLRLLCREHRSVAEVCRRLEINRQQFNKYLSGASVPAAHTLRRIGNFFAVDESALLLPPKDFQTARRAPPPAPLGGPDSAKRLQRYLGFYHAYYRSPAYPGRILVSLTELRAEAGGVVDRTLERLKEQPDHQGAVSICKYRGPVVLADDRIFVTHSVSLHHQVLGLSILYASHRARQQLLSGVFVSVSGGPGRQPFAARLVYEYLGTKIDKRAAVARCGLYAADSRQLSTEVRQRVSNALAPGEEVLRALEY